MILADKTIRNLVNIGQLGIEPYNEKNLQPASYDITLSDSFRYIESTAPVGYSTVCPEMDELHYVDAVECEKQYGFISQLFPTSMWVDVPHLQDGRIVIPPKTFLLATTVEYFRLPPDLTAFVEGRSSIGRLGLFIQNAGWVDSGFEGQITLELFNASPVGIALTPGMRIGQLVFAKMDTRPDKVYSGKYQGQTGATGSKLFMDKENFE